MSKKILSTSAMMIDDEERVKKFDDDFESSNQPSSRPGYIPSHMPPFPSKHTYKKTPVFPKRLDYNPTRIRKMRLEQSRLVENSLQRLSKYSPSSSLTIVSAKSSESQQQLDDENLSKVSMPITNFRSTIVHTGTIKNHPKYDARLIRCLTDESTLNRYSKDKSERIKSSWEDVLEKQKNL
ncbi:9843_t:CDS:2 [Entrophospora sp. SA101]|nr:7486_t:CDS:2 [Entrophospora sp. SA101]CAJ0648423.1 9843_t:CDS:2 [Entrophospora sp. SA101]CAJ0835859.1 13596_t:CDS:2 [Entrophospora sp. SA101]